MRQALPELLAACDEADGSYRPANATGFPPNTVNPASLTVLERLALKSGDNDRQGRGVMAIVSQLLKHKGRVIHSVPPDAPVLEAIRLMAEHGVGALLVMEGEQLIGVVSERDYARKVILKGRSSNETPVRQIMSAPVLTVHADQSVRDCMRIMSEKRIRHLPVVDAGGVIGVLSIGDLVRAVLEEQQQTIADLEQYIHS
jgi:CBS domain-containing protein